MLPRSSARCARKAFTPGRCSPETRASPSSCARRCAPKSRDASGGERAPPGSRLWGSGLGEMREARPGLLPPLPVEVLVGNAFERSGIHAAQIDREAVGVRARHVVGLHPAALAE